MRIKLNDDDKKYIMDNMDVKGSKHISEVLDVDATAVSKELWRLKKHADQMWDKYENYFKAVKVCDLSKAMMEEIEALKNGKKEPEAVKKDTSYLEEIKDLEEEIADLKAENYSMKLDAENMKNENILLHDIRRLALKAV